MPTKATGRISAGLRPPAAGVPWLMNAARTSSAVNAPGSRAISTKCGWSLVLITSTICDPGANAPWIVNAKPRSVPVSTIVTLACGADPAAGVAPAPVTSSSAGA